ncbi:hypothetical protein SDRG_12982 [Saprolegnia diclina VS20]|uniref:Uncharacterized protein n=1 Tax=Saprolegnia diclina (strain VS20) TaxID=1156394 RepID=T0RAT8_SAPDV|nr:hypothetical protein SDRG_12982 [Saprolegnia diclina VS20]EQC29313.1 hypothetical protein SDRG_12982 [Saprolegnia diclina VS20]|eukprot:XP_008617287.1 hypothetical protein SDRG_12982 [Saprolegnia diclina VS20]
MQWPASYRYRHGMTPLMLACLSNNLSMVQMLLSCSTLDLNAADNIGHTALLYSTSDDAVLRLCTDARLDVTRHHSTQGTAIEVVGRRGNKPATIVVLQRLLGARHRNLPPDAVGAIATFFVYAPGMGSHPGFPVIELFAPNPNEIWEDQIDSILSFLP